MVEVLSNWDVYVTNPTSIAQRGATYIFDGEGEMLYEYRHRGGQTAEPNPRPHRPPPPPKPYGGAVNCPPAARLPPADLLPSHLPPMASRERTPPPVE